MYIFRQGRVLGVSLVLFFLGSNIAYAQSLTGGLEVEVADYLKENKSITHYYLNKNHKRYRLSLSPNLQRKIIHFKTGDTLKVSILPTVDDTTKSILKVKSLTLIKEKAVDTLINNKRRMITFLLDFKDKKTSHNISEALVISRLFTFKKSVRHNYLESSFGHVDFLPDTNGDNKADVYTLSIPNNLGKKCVTGTWFNQVKAAANKAGFDLSMYQHIAMVLPHGNACTWGGLGTIGCSSKWLCKAWLKSHHSQMFAHELGHNLGMYHASTDPNNTGKVKESYGDSSEVMGANGYYQINAPHRLQLKWFDNFKDHVKTIRENETVYIDSLDKHPVNDKVGTQIVIVPDSDSNRPYYLSFRTNTGTFGMKEKYADKINIHRVLSHNKNTLFIRALQKDESLWVPERGYKFNVNAIDNERAMVNFSFEPRCSFSDKLCHLKLNASIQKLGGKTNYAYLDVPEGTKALEIKTASTIKTERIKLLVKKGSMPNHTDNDCRSDVAGGVQRCVFKAPQKGRWYIKLYTPIPHEGIELSSIQK
jgi:hypothetical protein